MNSIDLLAKKFAQAFYDRDWVGPLEPAVSELSIAEAYAVQDLVADIRGQQGEEVVGLKVGCTSKAIRSQFGLNEPIMGRLFRPHVHEVGTEIDWRDYVVFNIGAPQISPDQLVEAYNDHKDLIDE